MEGAKLTNQEILVLAKQGQGKSLKTILVLLNISQKELAIRCGTSPAEVSRVISGKRKNQHLRKLIAQELGVEVDDLFK